ncbi:hypothetical protein BDZ45DRAFT_78918 [Acephala macrosclerotiorum]|nr:hypothetical protein BDZ45DRAFT_78918 [Acephala macrosclerotiorum]
MLWGLYAGWGVCGVYGLGFYDPFSGVPDTFPGQGSARLYSANFTKHPAYQGIVNALTNGTDPDSDCGWGDDEDGKKERRNHWQMV